jgi:lysozyme
MRPRQKVTRAGILLIAAFEGLRRRAGRLPDGRWTIGYGHTLSAREGAEVSEEDAQALLHFDLLPVAEAVNNLVYTPLTQNQFDALTAFAYNVGIETFRTSDVLKRVNEGRLTEAACALDLWRKADLSGEPVILDALIRRRAAEKALFLTPHDGFVPTPSPLVRPTVDTDLAPALPQSRPAEIDVSMEGAVAEVVRRLPPVEVSHEPIEITRSDVETPETLPEPSVPVEAAYSDEIPVETAQEIEAQALEASEPGAEAMAPVEVQPVEAAPEPLADIPSFDAVPIIAPVVQLVAPEAVEPEAAEAEAVEPEAVEPETVEPEVVEPEVVEAFPESAPVEAVEPAEELPPVEDFPAAEGAQPESEPEAAIPAIGAVAERIYAPEPAPETEAAPEPAPEPVAPEPLPFEPPSGWSLTPPPEVIEQPPSRQDTAPPRAANEDEAQVALFDPSDADQGVAGRIIRYEEIDDGVDIPERPTTGPFILMGVIGLAAFGGAISAFIKARNDVDGLEAVAWLLALIGACLVGTSIYFLLKRLGGVDE